VNLVCLRRPAKLLLIVIVFTTSAAIIAASPARAASDPSLQITEAIAERSVTARGEVFLDKRFDFTTSGARVTLAGTADGTGQFFVDDEIEINVEHQDGTTQRYVQNFEFRPPSDPVDLSNVFHPGANKVHVVLRDTFGVALSSSALYLVGGSQGGRYVALGDSYASGEGADEADFLSGTSFPDPNTGRQSSTGCHRSRTSWANAVFSKVKDNGLVDDFSFVACSGAVADNLFGTNAKYGYVGEVEPPQLASVTRNTQLATLSIGGNDVGFEPILKDCVEHVGAPGGFGCRKRGRVARTAADAGLFKLANGLNIPSRGTSYSLSFVYAEIVRNMSATGTLIVTGYPRLFAQSRGGYDWLGIGRGGWACHVGTGDLAIRVRISYDDAQWINSVVDRGNGIIRSSVMAANDYLRRAGSKAKVVYVDPSPSFTNHRLCSGRKWFNGLQLTTARKPQPKRTSFHPNRRGQEAYTNAVLPVVPSGA
jgi:hypothetical protein